MSNYTIIEDGSVTSPMGFYASGITAGLKISGNPDMAMVYSEKPCSFGAAFTSCTFAAAPVQVSRQHAMQSDSIHAVIINSGNANACTGGEGLANAEKMCEQVASLLQIKQEQVFVASTGRIGVQMPMDVISNGINLAKQALSSEGGDVAAKAIMTTDTVQKNVAVKLELNGKSVTIGAMTKGVGMIDPNLKSVPHATMIAVITTDAQISNKMLSGMVKQGSENSFNRITVDGDMSTNDTVFVLANGESGVTIAENSVEAGLFAEALEALMCLLARKQVMDGEGATKFVEVKVVNADTQESARLCAEAIANSLLCKTAWFGGDPNWGRIVAALGYSKAEFDPSKVNVYYNDKAVVTNGGAASTSEAELAEVLSGREFTITVELNNGDADYWVWTSDISYEYVKINAEYHT